ncbi:MAG TPA: hypothetical protein DCS93_22250 [Microscillaceae bacterium]|nr:hypothetical protein [Microscillaceae bacterium]
MLQFKPLKKYFEKHPNKSLSNHVIKQAYTATFEFKNNILTVKDIQIKAFVKGDKGAWKSIIHQVFPDKLQRRLEWFDGILVMPYGKMVKYICCNSLYKKYLLISLKQGKVLQIKKLKRKQFFRFKKHQFETFKKTKAREYQELVKLLQKKWKLNQQHLNGVIQNNITLYTSVFLND